MRSSKSIMTGVAVLAALALPMVAGAANKLVVNGTDGTTPKMVVTDTGYVGVGSAAPSTAIFVSGATANDTNILSQFVGTTSGGGGNINLLHNNASTTNGGLPQAYDRLGNILFGSYYNSTTKYMTGGISAYAEGTWTSSSAPTYFSLFTTPSGSVGRLERIRVRADGNVGIGTTNPTVKLQVDNGVRLTASVAKPTCAVGVSGTLWFLSTAAGSKDILQLCAKDASGVYAWRDLF